MIKTDSRRIETRLERRRAKAAFRAEVAEQLAAVVPSQIEIDTEMRERDEIYFAQLYAEMDAADELYIRQRDQISEQEARFEAAALLSYFFGDYDFAYGAFESAHSAGWTRAYEIDAPLVDAVEVISVDTVMAALYPNAESPFMAFVQDEFPQASKRFREYCASIGAHYYADGKEDFFVWRGQIEAVRKGLTKVVVENLS